jgi:hypothetical protein
MSDLFFFKDEELGFRQRIKLPTKKAFVHQDHFAFEYSPVKFEEMTDADLGAEQGNTLLYDVECFPNYFLIRFRSFETKKMLSMEHPFNLAKLEWILTHFCVIGYNSIHYDILLVLLALKGATVEQLFKASQEIILGGVREWNFRKQYKLPKLHVDHIDLIEVAPLNGSLKLYAGRLHSNKMQDLPVHFTTKLSEQEKKSVHDYCGNDLVNTDLLTTELEAALRLRVQMSGQYNVDLRSKSDAQMAEAVIVGELTKVFGERPKAPENTIDSHQYRVPDFIAYKSPQLQQMLDIVRRATFYIDGNGYVVLPPEIQQLRLHIGQCVYQMGAGGLHSTEKCLAVRADENTLLLDRDVASYYPSIILNQRLYPKHLGPDFLKVYRSIVERRLKAKAEKNKIVADSLKITINGSFGKFGNRYSVLYSPDLLIQVTVTGQLALLLLIEMIEEMGASIVSANTDGVMIKCPLALHSALESRIQWWERLTGFETEETRYKAVYARDVNNYFAIKEKGDPTAKFLDERLGIKVKGCYGERGSAGNSVLSKNPENLIVNDAVMNFLANGTPIDQTIHECKDIRRFVTIRNVTGGAQKSGVYLGKVIRWYYSTEMKGEINRATKGDKIPNTDRARPLMELPAQLPEDIDYNRYIDQAIDILFDIGYYSGLRKASKRCDTPLFADDEQQAYQLNS